MTEEEIHEARTLCGICGRTYRGLGCHVARGHGITAKEYKRERGIRLDTPLTSDETEAAQRENGLRLHTIEDMQAMRELREPYTPGTHPARHNMGTEYRAAMAIKNMAFVDRTCPPPCGAVFKGRSGRKLCPPCRDAKALAIARSRP